MLILGGGRIAICFKPTCVRLNGKCLREFDLKVSLSQKHCNKRNKEFVQVANAEQFLYFLHWHITAELGGKC